MQSISFFAPSKSIFRSRPQKTGGSTGLGPASHARVRMSSSRGLGKCLARTRSWRARVACTIVVRAKGNEWPRGPDQGSMRPVFATAFPSCMAFVHSTQKCMAFDPGYAATLTVLYCNRSSTGSGRAVRAPELTAQSMKEKSASGDRPRQCMLMSSPCPRQREPVRAYFPQLPGPKGQPRAIVARTPRDAVFCIPFDASTAPSPVKAPKPVAPRP